MITGIHEMLFSKHYINDGENSRFLRLKDAVINTVLKNQELAQERYKKAIFYLGLYKLDKINNPSKAIYLIPKITFIENGKEIISTLTDDAGSGNTAIIITDNNVVITAYISRTNNIDDIIKKCNEHLKENGVYDGVYSILDSHKYGKEIDDKTIINLDKNDMDFLKDYPPFVELSSNKLSILSSSEKLKLEEDTRKFNTVSAPTMSNNYTFYNLDSSVNLAEKEYVVGTPGEQIYVNINGEPKLKTIRRVYRDEKSSPMKHYIEFEKTLKPMEITSDITFIIKPKVINAETRILFDQFGIDHNADVYFQGKIIRSTFYKKEKTKTVDKIGIIIKPTQLLEI